MLLLRSNKDNKAIDHMTHLASPIPAPTRIIGLFGNFGLGNGVTARSYDSQRDSAKREERRDNMAKLLQCWPKLLVVLLTWQITGKLLKL